MSSAHRRASVLTSHLSQSQIEPFDAAGDDVLMSMTQDLTSRNLFDVERKVAVITGGTKGIGLMLASCLVQNGCKVYIMSRKPELGIAEQLTMKGPGSCVAMACNVADRAAVDFVAQEIGELETQVDILVNNSGATWGDSFDDTPRLSWDKLMGVNVVGLFEVTQAFMPLLEVSASPRDPARVINIGSIDGLSVPAIEEYAYSASKAAVIHLTKASHSQVMAGFLAERHVTVNCICPGLFPSKMGDQVLDVFGDVALDAIPLGRAGEPSDIASALLYLVGPGGAYTTGANIVIDGGVTSKPRR